MSRSSEIQRQLDRYVGVPLAMLTGKYFGHKALPSPITNIGLLQPSAIGDLLQSTALMACLHKLYPSASIHLFHGRSNAAAAGLLNDYVECHPCDVRNPVQTVSLLRSHYLDLLVDLTPWPRLTAMIARFSKAHCTIGYASEGQWRHWPFDIVVKHSHERHELDNVRHIASTIGYEGPFEMDLRPVGAAPDRGVVWPRTVLFHVCAGGSRASMKAWPQEHWVALGRSLIDEGWEVGLTGVVQDQSVIDRIVTEIDRPGRCHSLCGRLTFVELASALCAVPLLVTIDTSLVHLASAYDVPMIVLHGPTSSSRWGGRNPRCTSLDSPHPAAGFISFGFERHDQENEIMRQLSPETVLSVARRKLQQTHILPWLAS